MNCHKYSIPNIGQVKAAPIKGISPRRGNTIRWCTSNLTKSWLPLLMILSALVSDRASTQQLTHALISPLPKVTNLVHIKNDFRQTFVLPQIDKVLERFQFNLNQQDLKIANNQHAFNKKDPLSLLNFACITQDWFNATDLGRNNVGEHALFIDLVDHAMLSSKLADMGVSRCIWEWT